MEINQKIYVSLTAMGFASVVLISLLIYPTFKGIQERSQDLMLEKGKIAFLSREAENREKMEILYNTYQQDFSAIEKIFVDPDIPLEFIGFLEEVATSSNLQLSILSVTKKAADKEPWPSLILQLSIDALPSDFLKFLEMTQNSPYLIDILEVQVRGNKAAMTIKVLAK
jgi:hypothetical protein